MDALAFTPWFVVLVRVLAVLLVLAIGWQLFINLKNVARKSRRDQTTSEQRQALVEKIELLLPQTQCGQCGYSGCAPYAESIADGDAINKCPPGGARTIRQLASLMRLPVVALDPVHGEITAPVVAFIREPECIGCTKCIQACPVDAILGAARLMHTVIASECTGCDLCVEPCPVDCIDMLPAPAPTAGHWELPHTDAEKVAVSVEYNAS
jgi:electron transport complex protein RnfB